MFIGVKPNIGWLGYILVRKSGSSFVCAFLFLGIVSIILIRRSQESLSLQFMTPATGSSPVIILPPPDYSPLNSFDACAVESAVSAFVADPRNIPRTKGVVYLYLWYSSAGPADFWARFLSRLEGIKVLYLNLVKTLRITPIQGMLSSGGWGGRPSWAIWLAAGGSLLWRSGGILMPNGVILTKSLSLNMFGNNTGIFMNGRTGLKSTVLGTPPHHDVIENILISVKKYDFSSYDMYAEEDVKGTPLDNFLTNTVAGVCNVDNLKEGKCKGFNLISENKVQELDPSQVTPVKKTSQFLLYKGDQETLLYNNKVSIGFFQKYKLYKFCPRVYRFLVGQVKKTL